MSLESSVANSTSQSNASRIKTASKRLSVAKLRWKMLSRALTEGAPSAQTKPANGSSRRFSSFGLIVISDQKQTEADQKEPDALIVDKKSSGKSISVDAKGKWYHCRSPADSSLSLEIRLLTEKIPMKELFQGLDNTGNVCLWPSEEVLAYYCVKNKELCRKKVVCELGGGMTCLSGLVVAATCEATEVVVTDGNERCVVNVRDILQRNASQFGETVVSGRQLLWGKEDDIKDFRNYFDVILCSDCLYFDNGREPLLNTIWEILKDSGVAVVLAPQRGSTFQQFVELTKDRFHTEQVMVYDTTVWEFHEKFMETLHPHVYDPELHYPRMIVLRKKLS